MLKQQAKLFRNIAISIDTAAIVAAFVFAYDVRNMVGGLHDINNYLWALLVILPTWYFLSAKFGLYASLRTHRMPHIIAAIAKVHVFGAMVTAAVIYLVEPTGFSRGLFGYFIGFSFILISMEKALFKLLLSIARRKGYNYRNILIVGTDTKALELAKVIDSHGNWGLRVSGFLDFDAKFVKSNLNGYKVLGQLADIITVCKSCAVDEVVFNLPKNDISVFDDCISELDGMGITVRMVLDLYAESFQRRELSYFDGQIPMMTFYSKAFDAGQLFLKRCLDIVGAMAGLILAALMFPFIAIAIRLDSPGPLLFGQMRVGEHGRRFICWKFRSMYLDAEERKNDLLYLKEERKNDLLYLNEMNGAIFKIADDPRVTKVGKFLRKTSLDEFPQFWNVLKGEMSLVGTRPPTPDEVEKYENWHRKRICIKPGITGLWQVSGRNQIQDFDQIVRLDIQYIENWSLWLDIKIILKTFLIVIPGRGSM